jgi:hypothetical protein
MGQPEGAGSGKRHAGSRRVVLARPSGRLYGTAMRVPGARFISPLPPQPLPEGSQRVGMGPRNQARRLPTDGPTRRQSGQVIHPTGLRLVRQVSLDSRGAAVPSGLLHVRGPGSGPGVGGMASPTSTSCIPVPMTCTARIEW